MRTFAQYCSTHYRKCFDTKAEHLSFYVSALVENKCADVDCCSSCRSQADWSNPFIFCLFLSGIKCKHSRFRDARTLWGNQSSAATSNLCSCPPSYSRLEVALEVCKCPLWDFLCVLTWPLSKLLDSSEYNKHYKICRNLVV